VNLNDGGGSGLAGRGAARSRGKGDHVPAVAGKLLTLWADGISRSTARAWHRQKVELHFCGQHGGTKKDHRKRGDRDEWAWFSRNWASLRHHGCGGSIAGSS
jgi:hypothetical protein